MAAGRRCWPAVILLAVISTFPENSGLIQHVSAGPACCRGSLTSWSGIYPTVVTPFRCEGGVDEVSLELQLRHELHGGVHGLLLLGTIGEGQYVSPEERAQTIATTVRVAGPNVPVVVGIHTCDIEAARQQALQAKELGAAAVLVKYLGKPTACPAEVLGFFAALDDLHALPILYYHYPAQTGLKLPPQAIADILGLPGVVGIKESTLNLREVEAHMCLSRGQGKTFLSGSALNLTQFLDLGGQGAMCAEAVLLPGPTVSAYNAYIEGRHAEARCFQRELFAMTPILLSRSGSPGLTRMMVMSAEDHKWPVPMGKDQPQARLKAALQCLGIPTSTLVKCPLPPLTSHDQKRVSATMNQLSQIDWYCLTMSVPPETHLESGGMLLKTGAFQLGSNVGRDLLRSQGDGKAGF